MSSNPLQDAQDYLQALRRAADEHRDGAEYARLGAFWDLVDHIRRLVDARREDLHYRADKTGPLVTAALRAQEAAMHEHAGFPEPETDTDVVLRDADKVLSSLAEVARSVMWTAARGDAVSTSLAEEAARVARDVSVWAGRLAEAAIPDEDDGELW